MAICRTSKDSGNFVMVDKHFINDSQISWKAKGLLVYFLSKPDDWKFYETDLLKHAVDGKDGLKSGIKELENAGYIKRNRERDKKGYFSGYSYQIFERPNQSGLSDVGKTVNGKTVNGQTATTNNNSTKNKRTNNDNNKMSSTSTVHIIQEIIDYLNKKTGKNFKASIKETRQLISQRLQEGFTINDFKKVIDNKTTQWLNNSKMNQYLRPETLFGTKFESYLNAKIAITNDNDRGIEELKNEMFGSGIK